MVFKVFSKKNFPLPYTNINYLFASLKLETRFGNAYLNPPQNSLLCDLVDVFQCFSVKIAALKEHKIEIFFGFHFEIRIISLLVMSKY